VTLSSASRGFGDAPISEFLAENVDLEGQSAGAAVNPGGLVPFAWPGQAAGTESVSSHLSFAVTDLIFARDRSQRSKIQDRE
jgi:hypothetical protein